MRKQLQAEHGKEALETEIKQLEDEKKTQLNKVIELKERIEALRTRDKERRLVDEKKREEEKLKPAQDSGKAQILTHKERLDILCMNVIHKMPINQIAIAVGNHYATIAKIVETYKNRGQTSIPLNHLHISQDPDENGEMEIIDLKLQSQYLMKRNGEALLDADIRETIIGILKDDKMML